VQFQTTHHFVDSLDRLILTYLIPCHLLTTHTLPTANLLALYPALDALFRPLCSCVRHGDLSGFDTALSLGEHEFVKRRIYLTLERGRDIALRNLFRLVFLAGDFEEAKDGQAPIRRTRIPVSEFAAAIRLGSKIDGGSKVDIDEVECFLANLIYKVGLASHVSLQPKLSGTTPQVHLLTFTCDSLEFDERLHRP
jgi:COP9 signalosome complex subunit 12